MILNQLWYWGGVSDQSCKTHSEGSKEWKESKPFRLPSGREGEVELRRLVYGIVQKGIMWSSLVVQWLRLLALTARGLGSIPGQGTRSHMLQLKPSIAK